MTNTEKKDFWNSSKFKVKENIYTNSKCQTEFFDKRMHIHIP